MEWIDIPGSVVADTVYCNNKLVAKDVALTLPSVTPQTTEHRAMGPMTLPVPGLIEAMEAAITKVGVDLGLKSMVRLESATYEFRWVQDSKKADGSSKPQGCKAFLRAVPKGIPGLSIDPGSTSENEVGLWVTRYQLFVDGVEYWLIDKPNQIMRIDGRDYAKEIVSML